MENLINITNVPKTNPIWSYSDPTIVRKIADKLGYPEIYLSDKLNKKYLLFHPYTKDKIYFGQMFPPMEDYTKHKDEERKYKFQQRNKKWKSYDMYTPAHLSFYLLWN